MSSTEQIQIQPQEQQQSKASFDIENLDSKNPIKQFDSWFQAARKTPEIKQPAAMCLATSTRYGQPSCRIVIAKDFSEEGFIFFTSYNSKKAQELDSNPQACCCFYWDPLDRQVTMRGQVRRISREQSSECFSKRPFESKISSYISNQGKIIKDKQYLIEAKEKASKEFEGQEVPTPEHWGGYLFTPIEFEFWQGDANKLDDRIRFRRPEESEDLNNPNITVGENNWIIERLAP